MTSKVCDTTNGEVEYFINMANLIAASKRIESDIFFLCTLIAGNRMIGTTHAYMHSHRNDNEQVGGQMPSENDNDMAKSITELAKRSDCDTVAVICGDGDLDELTSSIKAMGKKIEFAEFSEFADMHQMEKADRFICLDDVPFFLEARE